ncbi:MAG: ATP-binding protein [Candidatus Promineifilaceae bacterium]
MVTRKAVALLCYLAVTEQTHSRDHLTTLLWPDATPKRARASLRRALADLKKGVGDGWIAADVQTMAIVRSAEITADIWQFREALEQDRVQATQLYQADFLSGFYLRDTPAFEEWQFYEQESLRQQLAQALQQLIHEHVAKRAWSLAIPHSRRLLSLDPLNEAAHVQLMRLYAHSGQANAAVRQFEECQRILMAELDVEPEESTQQAFAQLQVHRADPEPHAADLPPQLPKRLVMATLQIPNTSFVGREQELSQIEALLADPSVRLLTLIGLGGIGKTRLGVKAIQMQVSRSKQSNLFADGTVQTDLTPVRSEYGLLTALADTLALKLHGAEDPLQQLQTFLHDKSLLWLIDNFEHLSTHTAIIGALLRDAPGLKLVVTSRTALRLAEEWLFQVGGLPYPKTVEQPSNPALLMRGVGRYGAVQLFVQRARQVRHDFVLTVAQKEVVRICQLVEGMPLAIEMAAAWVRMMSCAEIMRKIGRSLDLLETIRHDVADRHRSIRAVFDYSWALLSKADQQLLSRLSIFRGGFSLEAAQAICDASLFGLYSLVNKSLVRQDGEGRYRLHALLRQFSAEKLLNPQPIRDNHLHYYAKFLQERRGELYGGQQSEALHAINREVGNVYQAWLYGADQQQIEPLSRSLESVYQYHAMRSLYQEGVEFFGRIMSQLETKLTNQATTTLIAQLTLYRGEYLYTMGKLVDAEQILRRALVLTKQMRLQKEHQLALQTLGIVTYLQGHYAEARTLLKEAYALAETFAEPHRLAFILMGLGAVEQSFGNYKAAETYHQNALQKFAALDYEFGIAHALRFLGITAYRRENYTDAERYLQQSLDMCQRLHNETGAALVLNNLGLVTQAIGNDAMAQKMYEDALNLGRNSHVYQAQATSLHYLGRLTGQSSYLHNALELAVKVESPPLILDILLDSAVQLNAGGQVKQAAALAAFVEQHPASSWETHRGAIKMMARLPQSAKPLLIGGQTSPTLQQVVNQVIHF